MTENPPQVGLPPQTIADDVFGEKYARSGTDHQESRPEQRARVATALAGVEAEDHETRGYWAHRFDDCLEAGFIPGGRIQSGTGTGLNVTLINCFVQPVGDSMSQIAEALREAMLTLKSGGGVGYDFSRIRPAGALVKAVNAEASGPLSFMRVFDQACETIESAGYRRGAQMAVMRIDHPDIRRFIAEKFEAGRLTNFNVSVGATDAFMQAVEIDGDFDLVHEAEPSDRLKEAGAFFDEDRGIWVYERVRAREVWDAVMEATYDHADPGVLFLDRINADNNLWYAETIEACNPCGEEMLPPYGCCCLGSIDLTRFIEAPFTAEAQFDHDGFARVVSTAVRMLDNVLDASEWPLDKQREEAQAKRRIGLGYLGLGDALIMLGLGYDSDKGRKMAKTITRVMRDEAYSASIELAQEKGAFPLFDAEKYLASEFVQRLPANIRKGIQKYGIRNSHLLAIAPTGTIALAFTDNASNGIEPPFSWSYTRNKRMPDDSLQKFAVEDHAYRYWRSMGNDPGPNNENLPEQFVNALQLQVGDHAAMLESVQPFVDSAISKTCNIPVDYDYQDFRELYSRAWRSGLKGLTTFRPNLKTGAILETTEEQEKPEQFDESDADRRIRLEQAPQPALELIRWPSRPEIPEGNPAMTYMVDHPGGKFAVFVGHFQNGKARPFEVWINGAEQPRGLGAIAKAISMDMRVEDPAWLRAKLDSLAMIHDDPFDMVIPPHGSTQHVPSTVAALARLVRHRCDELGALEDTGATPMLDTLMSRKEPKTGADGTMSWTVDVLNPATGDDFVVGLKELTLPDGKRRPYSVWLAGEYPRSLDGLCKVLSYDMRVIDPAWIGAKLRKLIDFPEPQGEFLAWQPGSGKQALQPSTVAYIARLIVHRYCMLGVLDERAYPVSDMGIMQRHPEVAATASNAETSSQVIPGTRCGECGNHAVIPRDGCEWCSACGAVGACG